MRGLRGIGRRRAERAFVRWARETALVADPGTGPEPEALERLLGPRLRGARVMLLGEFDHFVHEKYAYRESLLRFLAARGFRTVGEEMGFSDGPRVRRFLATGDESWLDRVSLTGYRGDLRPDRDDAPTGVLADARHPEAAFAAEQRRFHRALRALGGLRFFGLDIDPLPGGGYRDLEARLAPRAADPSVAALRAALARVSGESLEAEIARLAAARARAEQMAGELARALGEATAWEVGMSLAGLHESFAWIREAHAARSFADLGPAMAARERTMHRQCDAVLARLPADEGLVLMSHNQHLAKRGGELPATRAASGPGGGRVPPLGEHLHARLGEAVRAVWLLAARGRTAQPYPGLPSDLRAPPGTLNAFLEEASRGLGGALVLPTRSDDPRTRLLDEEIGVVQGFGQVLRTRVARQADALYFVREVTPLRA